MNFHMKNLSILTRLYLILIYITGALVLIRGLIGIKTTEPVLLVVLCVLGSILHILKVEGATNRSHYTFSFMIFGFAMLHLSSQLALIVILISNLAEWIWNRPPWFIQLFNTSCYVISVQIAMLVYTSINPFGVPTSWQVILAIGLAMASFTFINHLIIGIVVWLARGENFKQSGIFDLTPLFIDLAMLAVGGSLALVWEYNPYALLFFLAPAYPLYMALKIPALERKTEVDQKTGLYNHQYFMTQFSNELQRANRYDRPVSIIMADLDLLRNINNTYGHLAGDEVLKGVAEILRQTVRDYDVVARFGGEEFAILMPESEIEKAIQRAEYIRKTIEAAEFVVPTSVEPIKATMSFGISKREDFEQDIEEILHHADTALYRSKLSGRNRSLAYVNNTFLSASLTGSITQTVEDTLVSWETLENAESTSEYMAASSTYHKHVSETVEKSEEKKDLTENSKQSHTSNINVINYISLLAMSAVLAFLMIIHYVSISVSTYSSTDWMGFAAIVFTIILTEWFSINLYVRNTSLSTSAVPIMTLIILFGPLGTLVASAVFSVTAAIKYRSPFNRIIFNFSNHIVAGILINLLVHLSRISMGSWKYPLAELIVVLVSSMIMFICTTTLISIGLGIDLKQFPYAIWKEQYQWMMPYYLGIGFISFALIFGYVHAGLLGILTMIIPLALLRVSQAQYVEHTRVIVNEIRKKNQELEKNALEINDMNEGLLTTLSEIIDLQDPYVLGHSKQVSKYASEIARLMGLNEKQTDLIRKAGLLHDIGKLGISKEILTKPTKLTSGEYETIKKHAVLGGELIKNSPSLRSLVSIIRHHHEYFDGAGYPDSLSGKQISIEARIVAVADAIEAMTSDRPYRKALKLQQVITELDRCAGSQFDPQVAKTAIKMLEIAAENERNAAHQAVFANEVQQLKINMQAS
jgi:diguanylate cyclase (GGDEF)-like protein/putative nucleotidyltransferase with HDIG domain